MKGIVAVEPNGPAFGNLRWGVTASRLEYDPPVADASELATVEVKPTEPNRDPYKLLAQPRKLKHLQDIPIAVVTAPASYHYPYDMGSVALLKQCGCTVEHIELEKLGHHRQRPLHDDGAQQPRGAAADPAVPADATSPTRPHARRRRPGVRRATATRRR